MEDIEILRIASKYNPWWAGAEMPKSQLVGFKRSFYYTLEKELDRKEIAVVLGPRRVGKTVLMHQLIKHLIDGGTPSSNILYLSLDNVELRRGKAGINKILEVYYKLVLKKPMGSVESKVYVFLDEVQGVEDWHETLKNLWDFKHNIKFYASGSSTMALSKGAMESLLGRVNRYVVLTFKFSEILNYNKVQLELPMRTELRTAFKKSLSNGDPETLHQAFNDVLGRVVPLKESIEIFLNRYLIVGGYPEFLDSGDDYAEISKTILEKLKFTFYQDIIKFFKIRNAGVLDDLFSMIASSSGSRMNIKKTADDLYIERPTLKSYLEHFKEIFLITETEFYSRSRRNRSLKNRKVYVTDTGVRNASIGSLDGRILEDPRQLGSVVECFVLSHLMRLRFILEPSPSPKIFYWHNRREVDFVLELKGAILPIEVKYTNSISNDDLIGINDFIRTFKVPFGVVLSKDIFEIRRNILIIPVWLFSLMI